MVRRNAMGEWVNKVVYVIDDDPLVLDIVCAKLNAAGFQAQPCGDPEAFLSRAPSLARGCLVLDLDMPGMSGLEVQQALSRMNLEFPIIFYSGKGSVRHAVAGMRAGAADFLQKSPHIEPLVGTLEKLFRKLAAAA